MDPYMLPEIQAELARTNNTVTEYFAAIPVDVFFEHPPQVWSPAENLGHLSKSVRAATLGLRVPQAVSGLIWGAAAASRRYPQLIAEYKDKLETGAQSPPEFVAEMDMPTGDLAAAKQAVLQRWQQSAAKLESALAGWKDEDLDKARLPHPVLGKLTVRELVFFTLYHNLHHVNDVRVLLGEKAQEA
ncbi:MAG: DinB family protein [Anaerolineales bacterium]|nr:DinB family protein [Anaerolineales bacterium]